MFPLAALGHFDFDARLLSVQSIDDTKYESSEDSEPDAAKRNGRGGAASDDKTCNRNWFGVIRVLQRSEMIPVSIGAWR